MEISRTEAEDIANVLAIATDFTNNVTSTNATTVLIEMTIDIDGSLGEKLGSVVWSNSLEEFVFVPQK